MPKPSVLIVDDECLIRMHVVSVFEDAGCYAIEASSADEAIEKLDDHPSVKAVFTDIRMPGKSDGLDLAHYILSKRPSTVVIICSGNLLPLKSELPMGARFVAKPVQFDMLTDLAKELCSPS